MTDETESEATPAPEPAPESAPEPAEQPTQVERPAMEMQTHSDERPSETRIILIDDDFETK